jgi:hypothetical protein
MPYGTTIREWKFSIRLYDSIFGGSEPLFDENVMFLLVHIVRVSSLQMDCLYEKDENMESKIYINRMIYCKYI